MPSAGQQLQSERLKRNRTEAEVADLTRISSRYIEALERDDIGQLPGAFFYKAFIRQYAKALNLDDAETERIVRAGVSVEEVDPVPAFNQAYSNASTGEPAGWAPPVGLAAGLLVAVIACGAGLYALYQRFQTRQVEAAQHVATSTAPPQSSSPAAPPPAAAVEASDTAKDTQKPALPEQQPTPAPAPAETASTPPVTATPPDTASAGETSLEVAALEPAWVQLSSDGKTIFIGTLDPSAPKQFRVGENARLLTGNAGALEVRLNGRPIGSIGPKGQVRTVVFSGGSFQIAPPKPRGIPGTAPSTGGNT